MAIVDAKFRKVKMRLCMNFVNVYQIGKSSVIKKRTPP